MKMHGKTIKTFLIDGTPNGRMTCELSNRTIKILKIPGSMLTKSLKREELQGAGVYLLIGDSDNNSGSVYIGESECLYKRLDNHLNSLKNKNNSKDEVYEAWNEVIVLVSSELNKAHIRYIEKELINIAKTAARYDLINKQENGVRNLSEPEESQMQEFIEYSKLLVSFLGYDIFELPISKEFSKRDIDSNTYEITNSRGADARGFFMGTELTVFKGSVVAGEVVESFKKTNWMKMRDTMIEKGVISKKGEKLVFTKDYAFKSPSAAAAIVMGRSANGLIEWKRNGKKLKDVGRGN